MVGKLAKGKMNKGGDIQSVSKLSFTLHVFLNR